jgi:phospholipid transport system transporter-binding protein
VTEASAEPAIAEGRIVADEAASRWKFEGALILDNAAAVLAAADAMPLPSSGVVDLSGLVRADSAALAVAIEVNRRALAEGRKLVFQHVPAGLMSLAVVYGVDELLGG